MPEAGSVSRKDLLTIMGVRSQFRNSETRALREKVAKANYGQYVAEMHIHRLRSLREQRISFDFPVTAIIGPNGGGKSTVLSAVASIYSSIDPAAMFPRVVATEKSMASWSVDYTLINRATNRGAPFEARLRLDSANWSRSASVDRTVLFLGSRRAVPITELGGYEELTEPDFAFYSEPKPLLPRIVKKIESILNASYTSLGRAMIDEHRDFYVRDDSRLAFSEFHFGAGEASIVRTVAAIEALEQNSLVLLEEIENGLHPLALYRFVDYLLSSARDKSLQVVFTTHSEHAISFLPDDAIWSCLDGVVRQGRLDIASTKALTGTVPAKLVVFVEDKFGKRWVEKILSIYGGSQSAETEVFLCGGSSNAISIHRQHGPNPAVQFPSLCYLDGDAKENADEPCDIFKLPGQAPERFVFEGVRANIAQNEVSVKAACHLPIEINLPAILDAIARTNLDPHFLFTQIGEAVPGSDSDEIETGFLYIWCAENNEQAEAIAHNILAKLPGHD